MFRVDVWEYERGWGSKVDFRVYFRELANADAYVAKFNSRNTASSAPDWYMQAENPIIVRELPVGEKLWEDIQAEKAANDN
jgi:hypothetical protein